MDFQRENNTPLDRIDENMMRRILSEYGVRDNFTGHCCDNDNDYPLYRRGNDSDVRGQSYRRDDRARKTSATPTHRHSSCCPICGSKDGCSCRSSHGSSCGSKEGFRVPRLENVPLSMVYSPAQEWRNLYESEEGFDRGTIFKELDFPWYPTQCSSSGCRNR